MGSVKERMSNDKELKGSVKKCESTIKEQAIVRKEFAINKNSKP
tara:strand:- start:2845 stop:2976 length:132 start_codon:yes stop_codon:yes gene_type:complete